MQWRGAAGTPGTCRQAEEVSWKQKLARFSSRHRMWIGHGPVTGGWRGHNNGSVIKRCRRCFYGRTAGNRPGRIKRESVPGVKSIKINWGEFFHG
ncbi:hypothetical protein A6M21_15820 [Desulfotomaculum copahuensis]|uniref:Uncharacterized protein n=1 Tax=Desulfotomaculum copahuensis TaxID=1838280 RepID=A0A1B7LAZ4_9FIRM|nr:hypothetical protein A6M21_15820 [Desulfotomaculum copahuensis]